MIGENFRPVKYASVREHLGLLFAKNVIFVVGMQGVGTDNIGAVQRAKTWFAGLQGTSSEYKLGGRNDAANDSRQGNACVFSTLE